MEPTQPVTTMTEVITADVRLGMKRLMEVALVSVVSLSLVQEVTFKLLLFVEL